MSATPRRALILSLVVATAALTGCTEASGATQTPSEVSSPSASSSSTPASTPSPSGSVESADPSAWVISFDGIGPVQIGGSLREFRADQDSLDDVTTDSCSVAMFDLPTAPALWVSPDADDDTIDGLTYGAALLGAQQPSGSAGPETEQGIGLGATLAELESAYPDLEEQSGDGVSWPVDYSVSDGGAAWIVFGLKDDIVDSITVGDEPTTPLEFCG